MQIPDKTTEDLAKINAVGAVFQQQSGAIKNLFTYILTIVIVIGFFVTLITLIATANVINSSNQFVLILLGSLAAAFGAVINYFFGSSLGSQKKDEAMNQHISSLINQQ